MQQLLTDPITQAWIAWVVLWTILAVWVKRPVRRESAWSRLAHYGPLIVAVVLLVMHRPDNWLGREIVPWHGASRYDTGLVLVIVGLMFTVWARMQLAGNWSGSVTVKDGHELIMHGPYRLVRHPIYAGALLAFLGTAIAQNQWRSLLAFMIVWLAWWRKWCLEERFMTERFGDDYKKYRTRVPAIIPGWPRR